MSGKFINILATLNLIRKYREYNSLIKTLKENNTTDIAEFIKLDTNSKFMVLFSHVLSTKIQMNLQMKILYIILTVLIGGSAATGFLIVG